MSADIRPRLISIIVPVRNEARLVRSFLTHLRDFAPGAEIIVVDGGSADATPDIARDFCDQLINSDPGRARQMNAGAAIAHGDTFWFLHADTQVPPDCLGQIEEALRETKTVGGFFRIRLPRDRIFYRLTDSFAHYAGHALRMRCGDHGIFCRRETFETIGGFRNLPLMEDVEFFRALLRAGRVCTVKSRLIASPRRYEAIGAAKLTFAYGLIATLYALGIRPETLAVIYRRTCSTDEPARPTASVDPFSLHTWRWRRSAGSRNRFS